MKAAFRVMVTLNELIKNQCKHLTILGLNTIQLEQ